MFYNMVAYTYHHEPRGMPHCFSVSSTHCWPTEDKVSFRGFPYRTRTPDAYLHTKDIAPLFPLVESQKWVRVQSQMAIAGKVSYVMLDPTPQTTHTQRNPRLVTGNMGHERLPSSSSADQIKYHGTSFFHDRPHSL